MSFIFVIGPCWNNLRTLIDTIEINNKALSNIKKIYIPTNDKNVEDYFKNLNNDLIECLCFSGNQGHQLSCYNSIIVGMKMVIKNEEDLNNDDIIIYSHEDCYVNNINLFNKAVDKINNGYDVVCRKYNGSSLGKLDYYMNDSFLIKKKVLKNIFENAFIRNFIENGYFCEKYFTELIQSYKIFSISYTHATWSDTELGFYHIPSNEEYVSVYWNKKNIDEIYNEL